MGTTRQKSFKKYSPKQEYPQDWDKLCELALQRDQYTCRKCRFSSFNRRLLHVDHVFGRRDKLENLQVLCVDCHDIKTGNKGFSKYWDKDIQKVKRLKGK